MEYAIILYTAALTLSPPYLQIFTDIFIRLKMKCSIQLGYASLNRTFHL